MALEQESTHERPRRRWTIGAIVVVVILAVAGFFIVKELTGDDGGEIGGSDPKFTLNYPNDWKPFTTKQLDELPGGKPLAALRRPKEGLLIVRKEKPSPGDFDKAARELTRELKKRIPDFQKTSSRTIETAAGKALFYSYIRKRRGTVHIVVLVPAGKERSFVINAVSLGGKDKVAEQIGQMILSFDA